VLQKILHIQKGELAKAASNVSNVSILYNEQISSTSTSVPHCLAESGPLFNTMYLQTSKVYFKQDLNPFSRYGIVGRNRLHFIR